MSQPERGGTRSLPDRERFDPTATLQATAHVRSFTPDSHGTRRRPVLDALHAAANAGAVDDLSVEPWPTRVPLTAGHDADGRTDRVVAAYDRYADWAAAEGVSLHPPFTVCSMPDPETGEAVEVLTLPELCLAVRADGALACVYPHEADGETRSVEDGVDALAALRRRRGAATG